MNKWRASKCRWVMWFISWWTRYIALSTISVEYCSQSSSTWTIVAENTFELIKFVSWQIRRVYKFDESKHSINHQFQKIDKFGKSIWFIMLENLFETTFYLWCSKHQRSLIANSRFFSASFFNTNRPRYISTWIRQFFLRFLRRYWAQWSQPYFRKFWRKILAFTNDEFKILFRHFAVLTFLLIRLQPILKIFKSFAHFIFHIDINGKLFALICFQFVPTRDGPEEALIWKQS